MLNPGISHEKGDMCVMWARLLNFILCFQFLLLVRWHVNLLRQFMRKSRDSCSTLRVTKKESTLCLQGPFSLEVLANRKPIHQQATLAMTHFIINILLMVQLLKYYDAIKNWTTFWCGVVLKKSLQNISRLF